MRSAHSVVACAVFATAGQSLCHIFYGSTACGGASYLLDGPTAPGAVSWLPASWNSDGLRAEVLQIESVLDTMCVCISGFSRDVVPLLCVVADLARLSLCCRYSVYVKIDAPAVASAGAAVSVRAEAFWNGNKIGQSFGAFNLPITAGDGSAYMSLLCIDGRNGVPFVVGDSQVTIQPPAGCT